MNHQHHIGRAEFETAVSRAALGPERQAEFAEFVRTELLRVIDQVFDEIALLSADAAPTLRFDQIEIDLGEIDLRDYRRQMPQRLRRRLRRALDLARHPAAADPASEPGAAGDDGEDSALMHYLRHGFLPGHAAAADALEARLQRLLEERPDRLRELFAAAAPKAAMSARLRAQFPRPLAERALRLLEASPGRIEPDAAAVPESAQVVELRPLQFEAALAAASRAGFDKLWQELLRAAPAARRSLLREVGARVILRQRLARRLSRRQFAKLVRTFEAGAAGAMLVLLQPGHWLPRLTRQTAAAPTAGEFRLREMLLGYLLVERDTESDPQALAESLLNQLLAAARRDRADFEAGLRDTLAAAARSGGGSGELASMMLARLDEDFGLTGRAPRDADAAGTARALPGWPDDYRRYTRLRAVFAGAPASRADALLLADIDALAQQAPWLLLRLLRELQSAGDAWRHALRELGAPVLEALTLRLATLIRQTVAADSATGPGELIAAIRANLARARSPRAYHREILSCLIGGDAIDFDLICDIDEAGGDAVAPESTSASTEVFDDARAAREATGANLPARGPRAARLVQVAELLAMAAISAAPAVPAARLQAVKWRLVRAWADDAGPVFGLEPFARGLVAALVEVAGVGERREVYAGLGRALLRNILPATRATTRRLIELLDRLAAEHAPEPVADPAEAADDVFSADAAFDEIQPDEDIHIANAGLVLLAPWLPRLFARLDFLDDGAFRDRDAAERAVHCLQFLVDSSQSNPEYRLVLNKILCGVAPGIPIRRGIELRTDEREQLEGLLEAVRHHWKALANTSIDGLRESFLQRPGRLQRHGDAWRLAVEARAYDLLLDQVPWTYATIRFGWMDRVIYVEWRQ